MAIGCAIWRAVKETSDVIRGPERTSFTANKGVAGEPLRQHPIKTHERSFRIIAAQRIQNVASAVERINPVLPSPEIELTASGAEHAHAQAAVLFLVLRNPILFFAARRKDSARNRITD